MALVEGIKYEECLTGIFYFLFFKSIAQLLLGFKYIGNTALKLEEQGYQVLLGYEEAIGYMFGQHVHDKDGVAATVS